MLVLDAHPRAGSFGDAIATAYTEAARERGANVRRLNLRDLTFDPILHEGYAGEQALEPDLRDATEAILAARHLVFAYPIWWGTYPALLKGFIDRTFLPGVAFQFTGPGAWDKLLSGRSARLITTMDWPNWAYNWLQGAPSHKAMTRATLNFCGVKPVRETRLGPIRGSEPATRAAWLDLVRHDARKDAR
jgi:NAD(P)H dehydrogenase (quinone)